MKFTKFACIAVAVACGAALSAAEIKLVKAVYGAGDKTADVTETVQQKMSGAPGVFLMVRVDNGTMGVDPAKGAGKQLTLTYTVDGVEKTEKFGEARFAVIMPAAAKSEEFKIVGAYYGAKDKWNDVTEKVRKALDDNNEINVDNEIFGPDPLRGAGKNLVVIYSVKNDLKAVTIGEKKKMVPADLKK